MGMSRSVVYGTSPARRTGGISTSWFWGSPGCGPEGCSDTSHHMRVVGGAVRVGRGRIHQLVGAAGQLWPWNSR